MQFIATDLAVCDPWAAVAAEYRDHAPRRGDFSLPLPYQATKGDDSSSHSTEMDPPAGANGDDGGVVATTATAADSTGLLAASQPAGGSSAKQSKKRKQSSSYQPNERELEAAARHAAVAPQLAAAAAVVQEWLHASGVPTVQQALQRADSAPGSQKWDADTALVQAAAAAGTATEAAAEAAAANEPAAGGAAIEPDYRAMFELRFTLKPKLQLSHCAAAPATAGAAAAGAPMTAGQAAAAAAGGQGGADVAAACARAQDEQQPPAVNLFNRLNSSEEGLSAYRSSSSSSEAIGSSRGGSGRRGCVRQAERLAWAGGHPVLLPPCSRFLMSDARQLAPLVADAQGELRLGRFGCVCCFVLCGVVTVQDGLPGLLRCSGWLQMCTAS